MEFEELLSRLLQLSPEQRAEIAGRLIESLDADPEVEAAWAAEAERRREEIRRGQVTLLDGPATIAELKAEFA